MDTVGYFATFLSLFGTSLALSCPSGFETHGSSCYFFSHGDETWIGAFESCKLFGAMLVEVNDIQEDTYLSNKCAALGESSWIGLTDKMIEGEFVWETSLKLLGAGDYTGWGTGEPDGQDSQNCVRYSSGRNYRWGDKECTSKLHYICELTPQAGGVEVVG